MVETKAREGDFVETADGLFFDVKGLVHPPDRIVCYLRYYPDPRGTRSRADIRYAKTYELSERQRILETRWPQYVYYDKAQGRDLQGVPVADVTQLHRPTQRLLGLVHSRHKDSLETNAVELVSVLSKKSQLPFASFGISGSLLVRLHRLDSDIDVIVYGLEAAKKVQKALVALIEENEYFHCYQKRGLRRLYMRRGLQSAIAFNDFVAREKRKVFQGKFLQDEYFIRCVRDWHEITEQYGETTYKTIGRCSILGRIVDDEESLMTPCRYVLEHVRVLSGVSSRRPRELISFRGRFAEQARTGEQVVGRGRLEKCLSHSSEYFRLMVGEDRRDIIRSIGLR